MKWFFQPRADDAGSEQYRDDDSAPGALSLPPALLERHGARVLDPGDAVAVHGHARPRPTVYRARTLLISDNLLRDDDTVTAINQALAGAGMALVPPSHGRDPDLDTDSGDREVFETLRQLPRPATLVPLEGNSVPVKIDAWAALQALRAAVARDQVQNEAASDPARIPLHEDVVREIQLEHLLIGSAITGSPAGGGAGGIAGGPGSSSDASGPTATSSYLFSGGDPRTPVAVLMNEPERKPAGTNGRRRVIGILDTGIRVHPWLDVTATPGGGYATDPAGDGFVQTDDKIQDAIREEGQHAADNGDAQRQVIKDAADTPMTANPLIGELNPALGHGTFIAGIVRQVAPDAQVLAIRVMHSDDILNEGDIICALRHLAKRIVRAEQDDMAAMVDVVSLSFGYFSESPHDVVMTSGLWKAIKVLLSLGVVVVAAAGNFATSRRFYPAAFAQEAVPAGQVPVQSVGALNPNGTKAVFSNDGHWVTAWAQGADVVSTYPTDIAASRTPELRIPVNRKPPEQLPPGREALDPNDYSDGFAVWSGTSFSAPYLASLILGSMMEGAASVGRKERAVTAVESLRRKAERRG